MPEMPDQAAMHQNAMFDFALKSAPNVLYSKYKQYGQVSASLDNTTEPIR